MVVLEEPRACAFYSVFHAVLVPLVCGILGALSEAEQLKTSLLLVRLLLLNCVLLDLKLLLRNDLVRFCNFFEACDDCIN